MSLANSLPTRPTKKQVLQQSNCNFEVSHEQRDEHCKGFIVRNRSDISPGTENHFSPQKIVVDKTPKSDSTKLRDIRFDLSSLKRGVLERPDATLKKLTEFSSDESSEEDLKKKRKMRPVVPNYVTNSDSGPCRKPRQSRQDPMIFSSQNSPNLSKSQPLSIARRNARERNRVKQVNEGFATLRNRIPDYISEAYNEEKGRKSAKKLSKVETLRMAVDYIRHLEDLLELKSTDTGTWMKDQQIKMENQPWDTPNSSGGYPSPGDSKFESSPTVCYYDQGFEYQDRIFYDYDLDFIEKRERVQPFDPVNGGAGHENENQCVDDFKYYESFDKLKKVKVEKDDDDDDDLAQVKDDEASRESENLDLTDTEAEVHRLTPKEVMKKISKKTVLPSITESFNKGIAVFY
ncbi:hypothetical protein RUM44_004952 [Polyplax serrata]|uniref:BHLH domain-containing protein n=1 Tax=Polyplax serrata TaxID=468196 RepID=A0ABR1AWK1_POLSC